jgi:NAD(P)-dependent dehydrogenase (short-subunit alcohol dehydrogenase family)
MSLDARYPSLKDRVVFVTGGGSGIGASTVEHFCDQGARVSFVDIEAHSSEALAARIAGRWHPAPRFIHTDLRVIPALQTAIARVGQEDGPIRVLVNNAANDDRHKVADVTVDYWEDRMQVNLRHQFFAAQAVPPQMRTAGGGSIVNFGSISWMSADAEGIRVNCVVPGWLMTERQLNLWVTPDGQRQMRTSACRGGSSRPMSRAWSFGSLPMTAGCAARRISSSMAVGPDPSRRPLPSRSPTQRYGDSHAPCSDHPARPLAPRRHRRGRRQPAHAARPRRNGL